MDAKGIVSALRCCNRSKGHRCSECPVFSRYEHRICKATVDRFAADLIESLQAQLNVVVPVVRGEWIEDGDMQICSNCGEEHSWEEYRASYCENCGAKMESEGST